MSKIFGIGLPKTGTSSLHRALQILGYTSVHYPMSIADIEACDASSDLPIAMGYKFLDVMRPGSKFILTVRSEADWLESCRKHFLNPIAIEWAANARLAMFGCDRYDESLFAEVKTRHESQVFYYFRNSPEKLMVINVCSGDGWGPLCRFLGKPVPSIPFPHENSDHDK